MRTARWTTKETKKRDLRHEQQREMLRRRQFERELEDLNYQYKELITSEIYSAVKCQMSELELTKELPGRDALKEVVTFLKTFQPQKAYQFYVIALKSAKHKVEGRRFVDEQGKECVIHTLDDVEQVIRESLRTAGICGISVKDFVYSIL